MMPQYEGLTSSDEVLQLIWLRKIRHECKDHRISLGMQGAIQLPEPPTF